MGHHALYILDLDSSAPVEHTLRNLADHVVRFLRNLEVMMNQGFAQKLPGWGCRQ